MKTLVALLIVTVLGVAAASTSPQRTAAGGGTPALIDGATSPEAIPDRVAYSLMLRLVTNHRSEEERRYLDAYVAQIGFENQPDVNVLFAAAAAFRERSGAVDSQVKAIKERESLEGSGRSPATQDRLRELRALNDSAADDAINFLTSRLSQDGLSKLRRFVTERVKRNVRMRPSS